MRLARTLNPSSRSPSPAAGERPLSVAYVSPGWPADDFPNGVIPYVALMADALRQAGHRAFVLTQRLGPGGLARDVLDLNTAFAPRSPAIRAFDALARRVAPALADDWRACRPIVAEARRLASGHSVQLLEMEEAFGWPALVRRSIPIPVVVRLHGPWFVMGPLRGVPEDAAFRRRVRREGEAIRRADGVSAPSREILDRTRAYYGLPLDDAVVIPPPTPIVPESECWRLDGCDPSLILFIGRFDRHKGADVIIDAFARVAASYPTARLRFVGPDGDLIDDNRRRWTFDEYLRARLPDEVAPRVEWMGQQPHSALAALRRSALATVIPSRYETFGLTVAEGMAQGCPLIASDVGGISEMLIDGVNGLLCQPGDAADLASQMSRLLAEPARAEALGQRARRDAEPRFGAPALAARMAEFYRGVLRKRATPAHE